MTNTGLGSELKKRIQCPDRLARAVNIWSATLPVDLIRACLLPPDPHADNYAKIKELLDSEQITHQQLLPQLHHNLGGLLPGPVVNELKSQRIHTVVNNQLLFRGLQRVVDLMTEADSPLIALKGVALANTYYPEPNCRPMADMDLLVRADQMASARSTLESEGWSAVLTDNRTDYFDSRYMNAVQYRHESEGISLDLHCHIHHRACWPDSDEIYWDQAVDLRGFERLKRLSDSDNLMHVCVHGAAQSDQPPLRWAMDAYLILNHPDSDIEWDRILECAEKLSIGGELWTTLRWLELNLDVSVPQRVMASLPNFTDRSCLWVWSFHLQSPSSFAEQFRYHWHRFRLHTRDIRPIDRLSAIPRYLRSWQHQPTVYRAVASLFTKLLSKN